MTIEERQRAEADSLIARFAEVGVLALWGGGSQTERHQNRKGHGFWLYQATPEAIAEYNARHGYCEIPGQAIEDDQNRSGNRYFWLMKDARELLRTLERCPQCRAAQDNNGLIAWCEQGHVFSLTKADPRYSAV